MKAHHILLITICSILTSNCSSNSESDLTPTPPPTAITYANTVSSIISSSCLSCHGVPTSNGASVPLNTSTRVKNAIINNQLIERISKPQGSSELMPYNGTRLPQATIDKVVTWKNEGYK